MVVDVYVCECESKGVCVSSSLYVAKQSYLSQLIIVRDTDQSRASLSPVRLSVAARVSCSSVCVGSLDCL